MKLKDIFNEIHFDVLKDMSNIVRQMITDFSNKRNISSMNIESNIDEKKKIGDSLITFKWKYNNVLCDGNITFDFKYNIDTKFSKSKGTRETPEDSDDISIDVYELKISQITLDEYPTKKDGSYDYNILDLKTYKILNSTLTRKLYEIVEKYISNELEKQYSSEGYVTIFFNY